MKKNITKTLLLLSFLILLLSNNTFADEIIPEETWTWVITWTWKIEDPAENNFWFDDYEIEYQRSLAINETLKINISEYQKKLEKVLVDTPIIFEWNLKWEVSKDGPIFEQKFEEYWKKEINLNIYKKENEEKKLIINSKLDLFVYEKSIPFIFDETIWNEKINDLRNIWMQSWIYIYNLWILKEKEISGTNITERGGFYKDTFTISSDYIWVRWEKEFLMSIMWKINVEESKTNNKINLVLISPFNAKIIKDSLMSSLMKNYLSNLASDKSAIENVLFLDESLRLQVLNSPLEIQKLESSLFNNKYEYQKLDTKNKIKEYFFISKFVNNLSNKGFNVKDIYIILILPFLFTLVSFSKHFIWISPMWLIISVFFSVLFFKVWILISTLVMFFLLIVNLILSKIVNNYTLLYTPKVSFVVTINIIIFIIILNVLFNYDILDTNLSDTIYIILFIIISERLIMIILSKEFKEYRSNLLNTFIVSIVAFFILDLDPVRIFILAYPEIIIFLVPINFIIWRFKGLRVTEYFRFREIISSMEEE